MPRNLVLWSRTLKSVNLQRNSPKCASNILGLWAPEALQPCIASLCHTSRQVLGSRWRRPPAKVKDGRRVWSFGHKLYALTKLKEFEDRKKHVANVVLKDWDLSVSFLRDWAKQEDKIRAECQKLAAAGSTALQRARLSSAGGKAIGF